LAEDRVVVDAPLPATAIDAGGSDGLVALGWL